MIESARARARTEKSHYHNRASIPRLRVCGTMKIKGRVFNRSREERIVIIIIIIEREIEASLGGEK